MRARIRQIVVFIACCCAWLVPATATADSAVNAATGVSMDVRVGYGGNARLGSWTPVTVDVANDGPDLAGRLEVQFENGTSTTFFGPPPAIYSTPATFPQHSHKRLVVDIPVPPGLRANRLQVRLVSGNQTVVQRAQQFTPTTSSDLVCGVLDQTLGAYDFLGGLDLPGRQNRAKVADLSVSDLPEQGALLNSLDCLVVGDVNLRALTEGQKEGIATWVDNGGLLIVTGGVNWQQSVPNLPASLLPEHITGLSTVTSLSPLDQFAHVANSGPGPWPIARGELTEGAVVAGDSGTPLLSVRRAGAGSVFFYALDPTQEPARSWAGNAYLWPYMLGYANTPVAANGFTQSLPAWGPTPVTALAALPDLNPPAPSWLLLFLIGYGLLLGPLAHLFLRRVDRQEWMLVILPLAATLGLVATVRLARQHQGSDIAATEVTLVRGESGSPVVQAHAYIGLFSPRAQAVDLHVPGGALFAPARRGFGTFSGSSSSAPPPLHVSEGMDVLAPALPLGSGALSTFTVDTQATLGGGIVGTLTADSQSVRGLIQNKTGLPITNAAIVIGNAVYPLGTLRADDSRDVSLAVAVGGPTPSGASDSIAQRLYPSVAPGVNASQDPRRDILDRVFSSSSYYGGQTTGGVLFVGWLPQSPVQFQVRQARAATKQFTLLEAPMNLALDPATVSTIGGNLMAEHSLVSLGVTQTSAGHYSIATGGSLGVEYDLPSPAHFAVQTLRLKVDGSFSGGSALTTGESLGAIAAFDWVHDTWRDLPLLAGDNAYQGASDYVSPAGQVRLRYSFKAPAGSSASGIDFSQFALSADGRAS